MKTKHDTMTMLEYEHKCLNEGMQYIGGIDEVGRGPLAGPVVVACCVMPLNDEDIIQGVNDSKKVSEKNREILYEKIKEKAIAYQIEMLDEKAIDEMNILEATKACMRKAIEDISKKVKLNIVLIDAVKIDSPVPIEPIIKGDAKSYSIACASILAKVTRDRMMVDYDKVYPGYDFASNKGYGSAKHIQALKEIGPCEIHRRTFIKNFIK